ncbi:hypothetical protein GH714_036052 [Hevea brasiliensis]|uniref:Calmodulin-binding domain-containing protein n=1 Tax=Hevea brasiliensis TaxID=3981 RepID=A0A6A6M3D8_HEVBR|nr:hypothetical protein GH714_036052 [Hevea brasiliensis]
MQGSSRTLMRKSSGGSDLKRKQNKSRSIKGGNRPSIVLSNDADMSTNLLKATSCSDVNKCSQMLDSSTHKAASSSVLKDSKFPEPQSGGGESEGISAMKVCTYNYCSIHGHRHSDLSPSNSFASMRRRMSKTEKSTKMESQSFHRANVPVTTRKEEASQNELSQRPGSCRTPPQRGEQQKMAAPKDELNGEGTHRRHYEDSSNSESVDENLHLYLKEKLQLSEFSKAERSVLEPCLLRDKNPVQDRQFPMTDSEPDCNNPVERKPNGKAETYGLWNLIYQHMVSCIASDDENQPLLKKMDKEEQGEDSNTLPAMNNSYSCSDFCGVGQAWRCMITIEAAIIFTLPSMPLNCDSDKGEKNHGASGELRMLAFSDSGKESMVQDLEEMRHKEYNINGPKRKEAQSNMVRNFNPWKSPHLPVQPGREADKIHLRHQTMEDRKTSEEGMLDCALQHVISKLAPAQKRKVALLFQAFETVNPLLEPGTSPRSNVTASSLASPVQTASASSYEKDQVSDSCTAKEGIPKSCSELNEPSSKSGSTHNAPSILTSEFTSISLKEHFGALNPDNSYHNYIAKDDDPDSISYRFVERGEATQTERVESSKTATAEDQNTLARIELILVQIEQRMLRVEQDISQMDALFQQIVSLLTSPAPQ